MSGDIQIEATRTILAHRENIPPQDDTPYCLLRHEISKLSKKYLIYHEAYRNQLAIIFLTIKVKTLDLPQGFPARFNC